MANTGDFAGDPHGVDLDPRIQVELEKLNSSTDVINKLELDLEEVRSSFHQLLGESSYHLNRIHKEVGNCVDKARPYYEARMKARVALTEAQWAAARFEKATAALEAAKEMVTLAEEGFQKGGIEHFDHAWQEMLNHATSRVNESEMERNLSVDEHLMKSKSYQAAEKRVNALQKSLKSSINKSRPYFEAKAVLNQSLDDKKRQMRLIEETIQMTKVGYSDSLNELEKISEEIHQRRKVSADQGVETYLGTRQAGVGAEHPIPSPKVGQELHMLECRNSDLRGNERRSSENVTTNIHMQEHKKLKCEKIKVEAEVTSDDSCFETDFQEILAPDTSTPLAKPTTDAYLRRFSTRSKSIAPMSTTPRLVDDITNDNSSRYWNVCDAELAQSTGSTCWQNNIEQQDLSKAVSEELLVSTKSADELSSRLNQWVNEMGDELSDVKSVLSVDVLDDCQIEVLMKEFSLDGGVTNGAKDKIASMGLEMKQV